jgi:type I restriction enzyme S subunit
VIEKKREQLKELDALVQSLFYQMFGDPITNEKGWDVKKFEDCYKLASGNGLSAKQIIDGDYPVYGGNGIVGYHHEYNLDGNNIIIGRVGALCGNVRNVIGEVFITDNAFILTKYVQGENTYTLHLLRLHDLRQYARDALQPVISNAGFKNLDIIQPPLTLQREFTAKIEAIEKQKELIKKSINEVETLFNSRMQEYFG